MDGKIISALIGILRDLLVTVNGQVRLWAFVLTIGPSYWLFTEGAEASERIFWFVVGLVAFGALLGVVSIVMAIVARKAEGDFEVMKLDLEAREKLNSDKTIYGRKK